MAGKRSASAAKSSGADGKANARLQMRDKHVRMLFKVWEKLPPLGEGAMDRKMKAGGCDVAVWEPIVQEFNKRLPDVNAEILKNNPGDAGKLISSVDVKTRDTEPCNSLSHSTDVHRNEANG